jgi:hypothetical protein
VSRYTEATYRIVEGVFSRCGRPVVELISPMVYELGWLGSGWIVRAEPGFRCDLASVPAWLTRFRFGRWIADQLARPAIVHDVLRKSPNVPKLLTDYAFWEAAGVVRVPLLLRVIATVLVLLNFSRD